MLEIKNLNCGYGTQFNLSNINLKVDEGEILGIIGPNGSGKTTLLRAITRVLKPRAGVVLFENRDIWQMGFRELSTRMAVVSQSMDITDISVEEFVLLGRTPYFNCLQFLETKKDLAIAESAMQMTGIIKLKDRLMTQMSGGERQLGLIARALAQEPKILLLDEPTTHLDISHQVTVLGLLRKLNKELGITIIVVLHDLNLAAEYCKRIALMDSGSIYKIGKPEEVLTYSIIEAVYKTVVVVETNPISKKPYVLLVSEQGKQKNSLAENCDK